MRSHPDYLPLDGDAVVVRVEVTVPWLRESLAYDHKFDHPGLREEFGPLPEINDFTDMHRRRETLDKRKASVDALAYTIARSIMHAMAKPK